MDNTNILQRNIKLNKKGAIYALTIIAVILSVLGYVYSFFIGDIYPMLFVDVPLIISAILFLIYISGPYKKGKATAFVPTIFILDVIATPIITTMFYAGGDEIICFLILSVIAGILLLVCTLCGLNDRKLFISSMVIIVVIEIISLIVSIPPYMYLFKIYLPIVFGAFIYNLALLIFGANNKIPYLINPKIKQKKSLTPEEELAALKELYDFRKISEEEYLEKRMEIISKI